MKIFRYCTVYLMSQKYTLILFITLALISSALGAILPYATGNFIDKLVIGVDNKHIISFCIFFATLSLSKIYMDYIGSILYTRMQIQMGYNLNIDVIKYVQGLSLSYINNKDVLYLNQRLNGDAYNLITFCLTTLQSSIKNIVLVVVPFMLLISINWPLALLMVTFLALYILSYNYFKKMLYNAGYIFNECQSKFLSKLFEQIKYIKMIKYNSIKSEMNQRAEANFDDYRGVAIRSQKANFLYNSLDGIIALGAKITILIIGGMQVLDGNFTVGMFTIFSSYFAMMLSSSRYFFGLGQTYQNAAGSYDRINDIFMSRNEHNGCRIIERIDSIELLNLSFFYNSFVGLSNQLSNDLGLYNEKLVLSDMKSKSGINSFSASFTRGKIYAVEGANGKGKSTLIGLLMGIYIDEYDGSIKYNGTCIREIDMVESRKTLIGYSEQEPLLINDSILYNLDFGRCTSQYEVSSKMPINTIAKHGDFQFLKECIRVLNMDSFIEKKGLHYIIDEGGANISGGEKQKISILKVLYKNPEIMIFDEPTSALDEDTTKSFFKHLQTLKKDKIIILVTHDPYILSCCDERLCL